MTDALRYAIGTSLVAGVVLALLSMFAAVRHRGALMWAVYAALWIAVRDAERSMLTAGSAWSTPGGAVILMMLSVLGSAALVASVAWHVRVDLITVARRRSPSLIATGLFVLIGAVAVEVWGDARGAQIFWRTTPLVGIAVCLWLLASRDRWLPRRVLALFTTSLVMIAAHGLGQVVAAARGALLSPRTGSALALIGLAGAAGLAVGAMYLVLFEQVMRSRRLEASRLARERLLTLGQMSALIQASLRGTLTEIDTALASLEQQPEQSAEPVVAALARALANAQQQVASLLRYAREYTPRIESVSLGDWLQGAASRLTPRAGRCAIELVPPEAADSLPTDPVLVQRILEVLVENAALAQPSDRPIVLETRPTSDGARRAIIVSDSGQGIPASILASLGTPFVSGWPSGRHAGLGIAVAQLHAGLIDARLSFLPRAGGGTAACLELPLAGPAPSEASPSTP